MEDEDMTDAFWGSRYREERGWGRDWRRWARDWGRQWERSARMFAKGDLKYLILDLLTERPRHGYDIIRALEGRFGGLYTPSAGAIYPTLQMLEDMGAVTSTQQDGRKVYTITDEGRRILAEHRDVVGEARDRVREWMRHEGTAELHDAMHEFGELMALLGREGGRALQDPAKLRRVRDLIARTREELRAILRDTATI
jgi:DNA-binding PadR family transcriptional regulator